MGPNVLLVVLDSVRARNTSLHGHVNDTTPFLRSFAANRATWYTQARAPAATSLTSHASIFTGKAVPEHGLTTTDTRLEAGHTVFEDLRDAGYATGVFSENTWITEVDVGLNQGFETVVGPQNMPFPDAVDPRGFVATEGRGQYREYLRAALASEKPLRSLANGLAVKLEYDYPALLPGFLDSAAPGEAYLDSFLRWEAERDGPWAACLNLMDAHIPYVPDAEDDLWGGDLAREIQNEVAEQKWEFAGGHRPWWQRRALEGLYDGSIRHLDGLLESLVDELDARGVLDDTLLVVTADHGEGFGERSLVRPDVRIAEHNVAIHECLVHVPLVVRYPGQRSGDRVDDLVSLTAVPDVVAAARAGDGDRRSFVTDRPVVSTAVGLDEAKQARAAPYVSDLSPYTATARAVYERADPGQGERPEPRQGERTESGQGEPTERGQRERTEPGGNERQNPGLDAKPGRIRKYVTWRDVAKTVEIPDVETSFVVAGTDDGRVDEVFGRLTDAGMTGAGTDVSEMAAETREQLEDLGYV